jgi:hypothetical protein
MRRFRRTLKRGRSQHKEQRTLQKSGSYKAEFIHSVTHPQSNQSGDSGDPPVLCLAYLHSCFLSYSEYSFEFYPERLVDLDIRRFFYRDSHTLHSTGAHSLRSLFTPYNRVAPKVEEDYSLEHGYGFSINRRYVNRNHANAYANDERNISGHGDGGHRMQDFCL